MCATMVQKIVDNKKVKTLRTTFTSLTRLWLQKLTQYEKNMIRIKWLMSPIGHIVDMVRPDLEFVEDSPKTRILKRVGRLFCVWILEGSESLCTLISTSSITKINRVGQLQVHTESTYFSVLCFKCSVEVCQSIGSYFMIIQL